MSDSSKILSRFPWLASVPHSSKTLTWQPDLVAQVKTRSTSRRVVSVLDDRVVFIANAKAGDETWVFYAELKEDGAESVVCERVAVLPLKVDMIALLPRKTGEGNPEFVTLKADTGSFTFRVHTKDGAVTRQRRIDAPTIYGHLVVGPADDPRVAVCTWSGQAPPEAEFGGWPWPGYRLDYRPGYPDPQGRQHSDMFGDTISVWDWERDVASSVNMREGGRPHNAFFDFLPANHFAVAAKSPGSFGIPSPQLQVRHEATLVNSFVELYPADEDNIDMEIAQRGSSRPSEATVHYHYNGGCLSILSHTLLSAPDLEPSSHDPEDMVETGNHLEHARTLQGKLRGLSSQVGNRVLIMCDPNEEEEEEEEDEEDEEDNHDTEPEGADLGPRYYIVDFDPAHVTALLALPAADRTALSHALANAVESSGTPVPKPREPLVEVIARRYDFNIHDNEEDDLEYERGTAPDDWRTNMLERERARSRARLRAKAGLLGLEYDERPQEKRGEAVTIGSACIKTKLVFPTSIGDEPTLAFTDSGILSVPELGKEGRMFYYRS